MIGLFVGACLSTLLLDEDFSCREIGCNRTHGITNYTYWRWSTTGSAQAYMTIGPAALPRTGNEVAFSVDYCAPPNPNPKHLGCYRSELALRKHDTLFDWNVGVGTSERWFGFANRLLNFTFDDTPLSTVQIIDYRMRKLLSIKTQFLCRPILPTARRRRTFGA